MFVGFFAVLEDEDYDLEDLYDCDCEYCVEFRMRNEFELDLIQESAFENEFEFEEYWLDHNVNPSDVYAADSVDVGVYETSSWAVEYGVNVEADKWSITV